MRMLLTFLALITCSCSKKPEADPALTNIQIISNMQEVYENGFPEELQSKGGIAHVHRKIPVMVFTSNMPTAYGSISDMWIYYKFGVSNEWRQCLRFSARSYSDLKIEFDDKNDRIQIFGIKP